MEEEKSSLNVGYITKQEQLAEVHIPFPWRRWLLLGIVTLIVLAGSIWLRNLGNVPDGVSAIFTIVGCILALIQTMFVLWPKQKFAQALPEKSSFMYRIAFVDGLVTSLSLMLVLILIGWSLWPGGGNSALHEASQSTDHDVAQQLNYDMVERSFITEPSSPECRDDQYDYVKVWNGLSQTPVSGAICFTHSGTTSAWMNIDQVTKIDTGSNIASFVIDTGDQLIQTKIFCADSTLRASNFNVPSFELTKVTIFNSGIQCKSP